VQLKTLSDKQPIAGIFKPDDKIGCDKYCDKAKKDDDQKKQPTAPTKHLCITGTGTCIESASDQAKVYDGGKSECISKCQQTPPTFWYCDLTQNPRQCKKANYKTPYTTKESCDSPCKSGQGPDVGVFYYCSGAPDYTCTTTRPDSGYYGYSDKKVCQSDCDASKNGQKIEYVCNAKTKKCEPYDDKKTVSQDYLSEKHESWNECEYTCSLISPTESYFTCRQSDRKCVPYTSPLPAGYKGKYSSAENCKNYCQQRYVCKDGACEPDDSGIYAESTCGGKCVITPEPTPTPTPTPVPTPTPTPTPTPQQHWACDPLNYLNGCVPYTGSSSLLGDFTDYNQCSEWCATDPDGEPSTERYSCQQMSGCSADPYNPNEPCHTWAVQQCVLNSGGQYSTKSSCSVTCPAVCVPITNCSPEWQYFVCNHTTKGCTPLSSGQQTSGSYYDFSKCANECN